MRLEEMIKQQYKAYEEWLPIFLKIDSLLSEKGKLLVAIDGDCGSGKTTCGEVIEQIFDANVFHMDDYYLPINMRVENWKEIPAANMDLERFRKEVLEPTCREEQVLYRPYDCRTKSYGEESVKEPKVLTVVEGSYSQHPALADCYDYKIFLTCERELQKKRLMKREGEGFSVFEQCWIPLERKYQETYQVWKEADLLFLCRDTSEKHT